MLKTITIDLTYQPTLQAPPLNPEQLQQRATSSDSATVDHWKDKWISHYKSNHDYLGGFKEHSIGQLYGQNMHKPCIVIGSGPSLKQSLSDLKRNQELNNPITTVSCLHNLGYLTSNGIEPDYYLSLDSGEIVFDDMKEQYDSDIWEVTQSKALLAYAGSHPDLIKNWRGPIYMFNSLVPSKEVQDGKNSVERFTHYLSSGGNALGACMYFAKEYLCSTTIAFVGADFCFSYDNQFHSYKSNYDNLGGVVMHPDVFGIPRKTWPSYLNFKFWFDRIAMTIPGTYINCSYGLLGAYQGGNIPHYQYMPLETFLVPFESNEYVTVIDKLNKNKVRLDLPEFFGDTSWADDIVFY